MSILKKIFGDANEKYLKSIQLFIDQINNLESEIKEIKDEDFPQRTQEFKKRIKEGESLDSILPEAFALVREASLRVLGQRHYDAQLIGGIVIHQGKIAEMRTGEGKTLSATLPAYLNSLEGKGVHVITVNDYLARRDTVWMGQIYNFLGLTTGCINHQQSFIYDSNFLESKNEESDQTRDVLGGFKVVEDYLKPCTRKEAYNADITYGTNNEFGFDYLKDNMVYNLSQQSQRGFYFAIIDEIDSILIDEARTPLIISAPDTESSNMYTNFARIVPMLKSDQDYTVFEKEKAVSLTEEGIERVEKILGIENIYEEKGMKYLHHLEQALRAQAIIPSIGKPLFEKDRHYVVKDDEIIIVDEFTGRLMPGRRWSSGLHQAIEAKEGVFIQPESKTLASITFQNLFRMYNKLSGMTGTAATSAEEFDKVYNLEVIIIPTNKPMVRKDLSDKVYRTEMGKFKAIVEEVRERNKKGQPVLIGTTSIEKNELLGEFFNRAGIPHQILNAKNHEKEGQIIAQAGNLGAVTIATNMAGRGVDIVLGGNPADPKKHQKVTQLGGLHVIGSERHEARRIDNQLRGRSGRQGDPGSSEFFISLKDDLLRIFGGDKIDSLASYLKVPEDQPIEAKMISGIIESAQGKIEGMHFDSRKHLLEYDDVMNKHREVVYKKRKEILEKQENNELEDFIKPIVEKHGLLNDYLKKKEEIGDEKMNEIVKVTGIRVLDSLWVDHLEIMQDLRDSVKLRAYGQKDPLIEYKNESRKAFYDFLKTWENDVLEMILKVQSTAFSPSFIEKGGIELRSSNAIINVVKSKKEIIGRNDPCHCGSGKKYKKCHGK